MDKILKFLESYKIPLRFVLLSAIIISAILLFAKDSFLSKLGLLEWIQKNRSIVGIIFLISACIAILYILSFIICLIKKLFRKPFTLFQIYKLDDIEWSIIKDLFRTKEHTEYLDFNKPYVQKLLHEGYIYTCELQYTGIVNNQMPIQCTLQPFIVDTLQYYRSKDENEIKKLKNKLIKEKNTDKKEKLNQIIEQKVNNLNSSIYGG